MRHLALRHWLSDGSVELRFGLAFLVGGILILVGQFSLPTVPDWVWGLVVLTAAVWAGYTGTREAERSLEAEIGYVLAFSRRGAMIFGLAAGLMFIGAVLLTKQLSSGGSPGFVLLLAVGIGLGELLFGALSRLPRAIVVGLASLVLGIGLTAVEGLASSLGTYMIVMGVLFSAAGVAARRGHEKSRQGRD